MKAEYPQDWDSRRRDVYKRDRYRCQNCRIRGGPYGDAELHAHHIVPKSKGGTNDLSNLQTLCKHCHDAIHHKDKLAPTARRNKYGEMDVDLEGEALVGGLVVMVTFVYFVVTQKFGAAIIIPLFQIMIGAAYFHILDHEDAESS